jgi:hypothetical protein
LEPSWNGFEYRDRRIITITSTNEVTDNGYEKQYDSVAKCESIDEPTLVLRMTFGHPVNAKAVNVKKE